MAHHGVMAVDELDELYTVKPEEFTALRTDLAAAAKKRGDAAAAKRISAARRPTTAAWVVNRLVGSNDDVKHSLTDLGERLRAAHAAMDGAAIRQLSAEQRSLVEELARAAFEGADMANPSATVREDVISTLQAAVADPDVAERLGRLAKAEQWSGFGDFGATTAVLTSARGHDRSKPARPSQRPSDERQRDKGARPSEDARGAKDAKDAKAPRKRRREKRHWPQPNAPKTMPTKRCRTDNQIWRSPGCVVTRCGSASRTPKVPWPRPRAPMPTPSRPVVTPPKRSGMRRRG